MAPATGPVQSPSGIDSKPTNSPPSSITPQLSNAPDQALTEAQPNTSYFNTHLTHSGLNPSPSSAQVPSNDQATPRQLPLKLPVIPPPRPYLPIPAKPRTFADVAMDAMRKERSVEEAKGKWISRTSLTSSQQTPTQSPWESNLLPAPSLLPPVFPTQSQVTRNPFTLTKEQPWYQPASVPNWNDPRQSLQHPPLRLTLAKDQGPAQPLSLGATLQEDPLITQPLNGHPMMKNMVRSLVLATEKLSEFFETYKQAVDNIITMMDAALNVVKACQKVEAPNATPEDFATLIRSFREAEQAGVDVSWSKTAPSFTVKTQVQRVRSKRPISRTIANESLKTNSSLPGGSVRTVSDTCLEYPESPSDPFLNTPVATSPTPVQVATTATPVATTSASKPITTALPKKVTFTTGQVKTSKGKMYPLSTPPVPCSLPYLKLPLNDWWDPDDDRLFVGDRKNMRFLIYKDVRISIPKNLALDSDFSTVHDQLKEVAKQKIRLLKGKAPTW